MADKKCKSDKKAMPMPMQGKMMGKEMPFTTGKPHKTKKGK